MYAYILYLKIHDKIKEMKKRKLIGIAIYITVLALTFFYIKSVLKEERVETHEEKQKEIEETYPISVSLNYVSGIKQEKYKKTMDSDETVKSLLEEVRQDGDVIYELEEYTYGSEILSVNGVIPKTGFKWVIIFNDMDITKEISDTKLIKDGEYTLKIVEQK